MLNSSKDAQAYLIARAVKTGDRRAFDELINQDKSLSWFEARRMFGLPV